MQNNRVKLLQDNIEKIVEEYYKESSNQDIYFSFFHVFYKTSGPKHSIYNYITHKWQEENEIVYNFKSIPCIVKKIDYDKFDIEQTYMQKELEDVIESNDLDNMIERLIPSNLTLISYEKLNSILGEYGYKDINFEFFRNPKDNISVLYTAEVTCINNIKQFKNVEKKKSKVIDKNQVIKKVQNY